MQGPFLRKYGVQTTIDFQLYETDGASFQTGAAHAAGDSVIMEDEGPEGNTDNGFTDEGTGYSIVLSATEMQTARIVIYVADQTSPAVWIDESVVVETYGNASAMHAFDLDTAVQNVTATTVSDKTGYGLANDAITLAKFDETTAWPLESTDTGVTLVARTGADGDTLETLSDQLDAVASITADDVWDEVMDLNAVANCNTARELMNVIISAVVGKSAGTGDWSARDTGDTKTRIQGTLSSVGERESIEVLDGT